MMVEDDPAQAALDELRSVGLHGEAAAKRLGSEDRFELPGPDEISALRILAFERDGFPFHQGIVAGMYVDVLLGRRTIDAALEAIRAQVNDDALSREYCGELEIVAASLTTQGRARESLLLSVLLLTAIEVVYGPGTRNWISGARPFIQAVSNLQDTIDPRLRRLFELAEPAADLLVPAAWNSGETELVSSCLSVVGQFWWRRRKDVESDSHQSMLTKAADALHEAAELREGTERGRTLATLAQVRAAMHEAGLLSADVVAATAREALRLVDRDDRPRQWLAARSVLRSVEPAASGFAPFSADDIRRLRRDRGDQIAAECLAAELSDLVHSGSPAAAASLLNDIWPLIRLRTHVDEKQRRAVLSAGAHVLDGGAIPCRDVAADEVPDIFRSTNQLPPERQLFARLHLGLHAHGVDPAAGWAIHHAGPLVQDLAPGCVQDVALIALADIHAHQVGLDGNDAMFSFRCALLAASMAAQLDLRETAINALAVALSLVREWAPGVLRVADQNAAADARVQLEGVLDGCLRESAMLDAQLGDAVREWLLEVGRAVSAAARVSPVSTPYVALAHSAAFKGAVTSRMLIDPGPCAEDELSRQVLDQIADLRRREDSDSNDLPASRIGEELRLCSWLHEQEQLSGSTMAQRRRNLESRYDDLRTRIVVATKEPWNIGFPDLPFNALTTRFDERTALIDLFLGRDEADHYCTYVSLLFRGEWRRYGVRLPYSEIDVLPNPSDTTSPILVDGLGSLAAAVRYHVQEPSGSRPVSRSGADALQAASDHVLGGLQNDIAAMVSTGCTHVVFCPHGPLMFLPYHLLPVGNALLADPFTVSVLPVLGSLLTAAPKRPDRQPMDLGIVASARGGVPFGLRAEPRIQDQAMELGSLVSGAEMLPDGAATPTAALDLMSRSRFAHIAAHGSALGSAPAFHRLFLDGPSKAEAELFAHQILTADLRGLELVTLCACETALGRVDPAGNVRGLPTAMLAAGAEAVIATLWPVAADAALFFFAQLHSNLAEGSSRIRAYRSAQTATRRQCQRFADWGAFTYIGAWE
jgi:hypothetical protein